MLTGITVMEKRNNLWTTDQVSESTRMKLLFLKSKCTRAKLINVYEIVEL